jgi:hypothetical protein
MYLFMIILGQKPDGMEHASQRSCGIGPSTIERGREYDETSCIVRHSRESKHHHSVSREMVVHEKLVATHNMRIQIPGYSEVCHLRKPFLYASPDARIGVSSNSWLIIYPLTFIVVLLEISVNDVLRYSLRP